MILFVDWLNAFYVSIDCTTQMVRLQFPNEPILYFKGEIFMTRGEFVSYLKARKMISKGCYYKVVGVRYVDSKTPIL